MKDKSIAIQCDEMTQEVMKDLQQAMESSFSRTAESLSEEIVQKLEPINSSLNKLRKDFSGSNEENIEKLDDLIEDIRNISKSIKSNIDEQINAILKEQAQVIEIVNKLESNFNERFDSMREELKCGKEEITSLNSRSSEEIVRKLENAIDKNASTNKEYILNEIGKLNHKIDDKEVIEIINKLESNFNDRFNSIQEEVEWGNKSLFARIFGRKR